MNLPKDFKPTNGEELPLPEHVVELIDLQGRYFKGCYSEGDWWEQVAEHAMEERLGNNAPIGWKPV